MTNDDINIRISLTGSNNFTGYQQEIDKLTNFNALDITNPVEDEEVRRFGHIDNNVTQIRFAFHVPASNTFVSTLTESGFQMGDIEISNSAIQNSFYIVDFYDSFDRYSQNKLFSNYSTKILGAGRRISDMNRSVYRINTTSQFYYTNVPVWFIEAAGSDEILNPYGGSSDIVIIYARFLFYNAKTGTVFAFYNADNNLLTTDERYYVRTELNLSNFTWRFISPSVTSEDILQLREIERPRNVKFNEKVNKTVDKFKQETINPPTGNVFNDETGTYDII